MLILDTTTLDERADKLSNSEIYWTYNALDCCVTYDVFNVIEPQLDEITRETYRVSMATLGPILEMMLEGLSVNLSRRDEVRKHYETQLEKLERGFVRLCVEGLGLPPERKKRVGRSAIPVSWSSPEDVKFLFHTVLGIPEKKRRKKGQDEAKVTSDRATLEGFRSYFHAEPFVNFILALRDCAKAIGFLKTPLDPDSKIRCSFNVAGTDTGRLSSSFSDTGTGTNLQNVTGKLKDIFWAEPGQVLLDVDLEQGDSRGVGAIAWNWFVESHGEAFAGSYLDACESGDLHTTVTRMAWQDLAWGDDPKGWKAVAKQLAYRDLSYRDLSKKLGHGCLTAGHEVLTPEGWVDISTKPSVIMQWEEGHSSFAEVGNWIDKPYTGTLHTFVGNSISAEMTHDHRVPYKADQRSPNINVRPALCGPQANMPLGDGWVGGDEIVPAKLIAAFMCDGSHSSGGKQTRFHFSKERKGRRLKALCAEYGYTYNEFDKGDGTYTISINNSSHWPKRPGPFMFKWTQECLRDFILELRHWDGHVGSSSVSLHSSSLSDLEWYQTFGRILGLGGNIQKPRLSGFGTVMHTLQQNNRKWASGRSVCHYQAPCENRQVYCPTVPTGFFYVRRNGNIFVTGNSNYMGQAHTMSMHTKLPVDVISEFQHNYFEAFPCIPTWQHETLRRLDADRCLITPFGRRRYFWGDVKNTNVRNAAIAYSPQSVTGEFCNRGAIALWHHRNRHRLPIRFLLQVHDSLVFSIPHKRIEELVPLILQKLKITLPLARGRDFSIPHGAKLGWNYGAETPDNPYGLREWRGSDDRTPPKRPSSFHSLLRTPVSQLK